MCNLLKYPALNIFGLACGEAIMRGERVQKQLVAKTRRGIQSGLLRETSSLLPKAQSVPVGIP